jgi:AraC-like DNA-binding protein
MKAATNPESISFSESLVKWHRMICGDGSLNMAEPDSGDICFLGSPISSDVGAGSVDLITFGDDFGLLNLKGAFHEPVHYRIIGEGWTRLHFRTAARSAMDFEGIGQTEYEGPLCQILHQPVGVGDEEWIEANARLDWVTLFMRPNLLVDRFHMDSIRLVDPVRRLANGCDDFLLTNWSLSADMSRALNQLLNTAYEGDLRRVHLEAKAMELVCMMSDVMTDRSDSKSPVKLTAPDIERLHEVRALLGRSLTDPPSIVALSRQVGINRNKLSYGFKHLFGATISEFCRDSRLQAGWDLLRDTSLPISLVAEKVGYRQPAAFSNAFRTRFGISPRQARRGMPSQHR